MNRELVIADRDKEIETLQERFKLIKMNLKRAKYHTGDFARLQVIDWVEDMLSASIEDLRKWSA